MLNTNFITDAIIQHLPSKRRMNASGWMNINAVCCQHNGENADTRMRGGFFRQPDGSFVYSCFNCGFKASWKPGRYISRKVKNFLRWLNVSNEEIRRLSFEADKLKLVLDSESTEQKPEIPTNFDRHTFKAQELPEGSRLFDHWLNEEDIKPKFIEVLNYTMDRGKDIIENGEFYWTPFDGKYEFSSRVIIPFKVGNKIVGWTARKIKEGFGRYIASEDYPEHFLFNNNVLYDIDRKYVILVEGPFDAIAIDGVAVLGNKISKEQAAWINSSGKEVIVLPDFQGSGIGLVNAAIENNWKVSYPKGLGSGINYWDADIKDAADAVRKYGRLWTLYSILQSATDDKIRIRIEAGRYIK